MATRSRRARGIRRSGRERRRLRAQITFFSGRPREVQGKLRIQRYANGPLRDAIFRFTVRKPKDVAESGVFAVE